MTKEGWHAITKRPMTEEERKEWSEKLGSDIYDEDAYIYGNCPEDGQEVILTTTWGAVVADCYCNDGVEMGFSGFDMDEVIAWMPLPGPYNPEGGQE